jgi:lactate dehydrogenase-like 2-hydroxyacid dehydrogenase
MSNKILTICTLKDALIEKYKDQIDYLPMSNEETDKSWRTVLQKYQPQTILFGLQYIDEQKLSLWRKLQPNAKLKFVRKGTSLHRVDFTAAKKYAVDILNTPGVNALFVAEFIVNLLLSANQPNKMNSTIAVLGIGSIGSQVVERLLKTPCQMLLYSRTHHQFSSSNYIYNDNLLEIFSRGEQVAICLPLTEATKGIITKQHILTLPQQAQIICISPPRVMSTDAIIALNERRDIHVTFDHVASGLTFIHDSLGQTTLPNNFVFDEKAASGDECQYAMGEAAIKIALSDDNIFNMRKK